MNSGFFLIDKDEGVSSARVVSKLKKKFNFKKVGHTGTLDPFATGLLVCPINSATRLSNFVLDTKKVYSGIILLGKKTDSDDITGNVMSESSDFKFTFNDILKIRDSFLGKITQVPPKLSAIKIDGKRAYDKFRKNEDFEMKERAVEVFSFEIFPPKQESNIDTIYNTLEELKGLSPDFISVTYGAGGSLSKNMTCEISSIIKNKYKIEPLAHLTCINSTKDQVDKILNDLKKEGIENVLALRGDIPIDFDGKSDFKYASDLIKHIKLRNDFNIVGACYPEGHLDSKSYEDDLINLKKKQET